MSVTTPETLALVKRRLEEIERNVQLVKQLISDDAGERARSSSAVTPTGPVSEPGTGPRVIHGRFDGEHMEGEDGQLYPVPANYASKSKLVEGDGLKLTIEPDGSFVYKQIKPIDRRRVLGTFTLDASGNYVVEAEEKAYRILLASVTFYKLDLGDQVTILLPAEGDAQWGAVENALKATRSTTRSPAQDDSATETAAAS